MANQGRLADNLNHYDANRHGVPRQGNALLQGIAICGRCGRRMGLHYSGQQATTRSIFVAPISINMATPLGVAQTLDGPRPERVAPAVR